MPNSLLSHPRNELGMNSVRPSMNSTDCNLRVVLYSHDTMGMGHFRRNLLIAQALSGPCIQATVLLVSGTHEAGRFTIPQHVDLLSLPAAYKTGREQYTSRHLGVSMPVLTQIRSKTILASVQAFHPDVLIADKVPQGLNGELEESLRWLRETSRTYCVLGLRDVLDDPETVRAEWNRKETEQCIREHYDSVWIYGDPRIYDAVNEYRFSPDLRRMACYTGYLNQKPRLELWQSRACRARLVDEPIKRPYALCVVGGGQDGDVVAKAFAAAKRPSGMSGVIVTGPYMPETEKRSLKNIAAGDRDLTVIEFCPEVDVLLSQASRVISMGGYNTICSILSHDIPALVVPRVWPRMEQLVRVERLQTNGLVSMLHPAKLSSQAISEWLFTPCQTGSFKELNLQGLPFIQSALSRHIPAARVHTHRSIA